MVKSNKEYTPRMHTSKLLKYIAIFTWAWSAPLHGQTVSDIAINQQLWNEFNNSERVAIVAKFPKIEIIPAESIGFIQSAQIANRSTAGTNSGAAIGGALGQAVYIDNAFKGSGQNYSATAQLGAGLLGALLGSATDTATQQRFVFNYGVKTLDGQIREIRVESSEEFTRPIGQCVFVPAVMPAPVALCATDKAQFVRKLSALSQAPEGSTVSGEITGVRVNCRVPGIGLMTLDKSACIQMEGSVEK
jgi:outer membrane lipoprotein SlyB